MCVKKVDSDAIMGAGLPMVVTAAEVILGSTATVYGASNNMEALSNLYQAMGGDARSTAFNPIRDTIFASNPELYYKIGNTATMLTVLSLPVGMSMEAAVAVGGSPLRAGITELGKFGISTMAGEVTTDKVTEWTGSEALGIIAGMGTSSLSYGGLSAVDYKVNISGLHGTGGNTQIGNVTGSGKGGSNYVDDIIRDGSQLENGKLKSNIKYKTGEHEYIYQTNEDGLISHASTDNLQIKTHEGRLNHNSNTYGKEIGDHAGHIFGDRFGGSPELDNLVSQAQRVNQSEFKVIENEWAKALENGKKVTVDIDINYASSSSRPTSFDVSYIIDDIPFFKHIEN